MTIWRQLTLAAFAVISLQQHAIAAGDQASLPKRKPGLWELKSTMDEGLGPRENTMKMCIDATMEENTVNASIAEHRASCEKYEIKTTAAGMTVDAACTYSGRHVTSLTEMSGDFSSAFSVKISTTTSDEKASTAQSVVVTRTITQDGKFLSESCGDLKPGEAMTADGAKVLVQ